MSDQRICYKMEHDPERWVEVDPMQLSKGDTFKLEEKTGKIVGIFAAASDAYRNEDDIWQIDI